MNDLKLQEYFDLSTEVKYYKNIIKKMQEEAQMCDYNKLYQEHYKASIEIEYLHKNNKDLQEENSILEEENSNLEARINNLKARIKNLEGEKVKDQNSNDQLSSIIENFEML